jgi:hypothetical protein
VQRESRNGGNAMPESQKSPDSSPSTAGGDEMRNRILEEHAKKYPEGDPSVRRISPDKGRIGPSKKGK